MCRTAGSVEAMARKWTEASQKKKRKEKKKNEEEDEEKEEEKYVATLYAHTNGLRVVYRS